MADLGILGKQAGPLPIGAWIALVAGGLGMAYYINRNQSAQPTQVPLVEAGVGAGGNQFIYDEPTPVVPQTPEMDETNDAWGRQVTNWLIGQDLPPFEADNMVRKYLSGEPLTVKEVGMINLALVKFGAPPEPIRPVEQPLPEEEPEQQPPSGPVKDLRVYRNPGVNLLMFRSPANTDYVEINVSGSNGYRYSTNVSVLPGGLHTRYSHFAPPQSRGVNYTYQVIPISGTPPNIMKGPAASTRATFVAISGWG